MRKLPFEIRHTEYRYERKEAFEIYQKIRLLRVHVASLVKVFRRVGLRAPVGLRESVRDLRECYTELINGNCARVTISRDYAGVHIERVYSVFSATERRETLRYIRHEVQSARHDMRDVSPDVHTSRNYFFNRQREKAYNGKRPTDDGAYIGIELECVVPTDNNLKIELMPWRKYLSISGDGSINCDSENDDAGSDDAYEGEEYKILARREVLGDVVRGVTQTLVNAGATVNKSCGLHVHLDMRYHNRDARELIYSKLYHALRLLKTIVPQSRRNNDFCRLNRNNKPSYRGSRYRAINTTAYNRHTTFEIRLFNGTLDAEKILNWIELLTRIMESAPVLRCPHTWKTAAKAWGLSPALVEWCEARQRKFSPAPRVLSGGTVIDANEGRDDSANPAPVIEGAPFPALMSPLSNETIWHEIDRRRNLIRQGA